MNNQNVITHRVVAGDSLYRLKQQYNTTIDTILQANPYLDPNRLKIGDEIVIYIRQEGLKDNSISPAEVELMSNMRSLWEQHVVWTRLLIISIIDNLGDIDYVTRRLLRNPMDLGNLFKAYYGAEVANKITALLTDHLVIGAELIKALKAGDMTNATNLDRAWYKNADDMAAAFASINPYYAENEIRQMLHTHLDLTKREVSDRLARNYEADIRDFDNIERQALMMADAFTEGIINQFPNRF